MKRQIVVANGTCLDVLDDHRSWLESQAIEVIAARGILTQPRGVFRSCLKEAAAVIGPLPGHLLPIDFVQCHSLQVVSLASSGFESIDLMAATASGVVVTNAIVQAGAEVVADHTWALMLSVARQIPDHHHKLQLGNTQRGMGVAVYGKTLGIIGLGNIGKAVARRAAGFDMRVLATGMGIDAAFIERHHVEVATLEELLQRSDFVSLHLRIAAQTNRIISERELKMMKRTAFLINTARAELVDEAALTRAILDGTLAGAALDDPPATENSPLLQLPNVVCTPHLGNRAIEGVQAVTRCALQNAVDVLDRKRPKHVVNPQVYLQTNLRAQRTTGQNV